MAKRKPKHSAEVFLQRREKLAEIMKPGSALVVAANPEAVRNNDVHHPYRQDTNMMYLTGFEEPGSAFVFIPGSSEPAVLFVREKNLEMETWEGFRFGPEAAKADFGLDASFPEIEFEDRLPQLLKACDKIYYSLFHNPDFDLRLQESILQLKSLNRRTGKGLITIADSTPLLGEMRLIKSDFEKNLMRKACQVSAEAHVELMKNTRPGVNERALHGLFLKEIMQRGAAREGYGSIIATGDNATTLHYVFNDCELKEGELLLVDAGAECDYYTGDITRTYPVSGKFTPAQKRLYESVLRLQKDLIASVKPGGTLAELQKRAVEHLTSLMIQEGLLKGSVEEAIEKNEYKKFYPHGIGHWLGSDVHDAGRAQVGDKPRPFEPGMCFTIEPGLYIPEDTEGVPKELCGIGIRIEDNILVTEDGFENMTAHVPKEVEDLESVVGTSPQF